MGKGRVGGWCGCNWVQEAVQACVWVMRGILRQMGPQCWAGLKTWVSVMALQVRAQGLMLRPPLHSLAPDHHCSTRTGGLSAPAAAATLLALPTRPS